MTHLIFVKALQKVSRINFGICRNREGGERESHISSEEGMKIENKMMK